ARVGHRHFVHTPEFVLRATAGEQIGYRRGEAVDIIGVEVNPAASGRSPDPRIGAASRGCRSHSAARSSSAPPRSTLTSRLTPFSTMVTPNSRCIRLIVTALWVTIR